MKINGEIETGFHFSVYSIGGRGNISKMGFRTNCPMGAGNWKNQELDSLNIISRPRKWNEFSFACKTI